MKKLLISLAFAILAAQPALADVESAVQVDDTFQKTKEWLSEQHLVLTGDSSGARDDAAAFRQDALLFCGEAVGNPNHLSPAQREMMAKRAAVIVAQRSLAEYLSGFSLVSDGHIKDTMAESESIRSAVSSLVRGTQVVFQEYNPQKDMAIAIIKVGLHGPDGFASRLYKKLAPGRDVPGTVAVPEADLPVDKEPAAASTSTYDGLIVDAVGLDFKPALFNRVFSEKGEVLYDPSKIGQKVLVEHGCGEYTNSVEKAKAVLLSRGVKNPLVVRASGVEGSSDLKVSDSDAVNLFTANQQGGFLSDAKVAFVLK